MLGAAQKQTNQKSKINSKFLFFFFFKDGGIYPSVLGLSPGSVLREHMLRCDTGVIQVLKPVSTKHKVGVLIPVPSL